MTPVETADLLRLTFRLFRPGITPDLKTLVPDWHDVLRDTPHDIAAVVVKETTGEHPPAASHIRELVMARTGNAPTSEAVTVVLVTAAIARRGQHGGFEAQADLDPFVWHVVSSMGGWSQLCRSADRDLADRIRTAHRAVRRTWTAVGSPALPSGPQVALGAHPVPQLPSVPMTPDERRAAILAGIEQARRERQPLALTNGGTA